MHPKTKLIIPTLLPLPSTPKNLSQTVVSMAACDDKTSNADVEKCGGVRAAFTCPKPTSPPSPPPTDQISKITATNFAADGSTTARNSLDNISPLSPVPPPNNLIPTSETINTVTVKTLFSKNPAANSVIKSLVLARVSARYAKYASSSVIDMIDFMRVLTPAVVDRWKEENLLKIMWRNTEAL
ncbi:hypothetical protein TL16_g10743 [Triparma laevis f. inornata]|uniref:Uncharacterized protein n=2 Tax=Triparma laevis TaxID=1534972 RepID=A0A9W7AGB4_9STRA|nr:hypothetical protein TrLO_g14708 [Triparma laevis f. longispina]GMH87079.1 hypothetical protein TL16_g10743 [Triparma laevis f. inornata]